MSNDVAVIEAGLPMNPASLNARLAVIQQCMQQSMKKGEDYGKIPGTAKPTLFQPGAQKLCTLFSIAPDYEVEDLSTRDCVRIRVKCVGRHQETKAVLGSGVGECSTDETKYKWRRPVCQAEFDETPEDRRRSKWMVGKGGKPFKALQVRTDPADLANTALKMASKRAHIAMVLNVTGATAIFTQDVEDLPRDGRPPNVDEDGVIHDDEPAPRRQAQTKPNASATINDQQLKMLQLKMDQAGMTAEQMCQRFGIDALIGLKFADLNAALAYVADPQMNGG